jgi:hypothetical protein
MRWADKWLFGITAFSLLLVATSLALVLIREKPQYWPEGTPLATAHNYILAFKQKDLARVHSYLSPTLEGYPPSVNELINQISKSSSCGHLSFALKLELNGTGEDETAEVRVWERRFFGNPLELIFGFQKGIFEGVYFGRDHIPEEVLEKILTLERDERFTYFPTKIIPDGHFIRSFDMQLQLENGDWKIVDSQCYWLRCWEVVNGCELFDSVDKPD